MSSSDDDDYSNAAPVAQEITYPLNEEREVPNTNGKLFKTVLEEGTGPKPPKNSKVTVSYSGTLASDGSTFDSSDSFDFKLGVGQVIKGWDQGVATMRKGERAILRCLPEYAYGEAGSPPRIPANSTLNFNVKLFDWTKSEDISAAKDRSIMKAVKAEGRNYDTPDYESEVTADVVVSVGAADAESKREVARREGWAVTIGETPLPVGLEAALSSMKEGEEADVTVAAHLVTADNAEFGIVAGSEVTYGIVVKSFKKVKTWSYSGAEKVTQGAKRKDQGNAYFKEGQWEAAEKKYRRCLEFVEYDYGLEGDSKAEAEKLKLASLSNLAQVLINMKRYGDAVTECNKALAIDGSNLKVLFRRGRALSLTDDWDAAKQDLQRVLDVDPGNADAQRELAMVREKIRAFDRSQKAKFGNLFAKLSAMEEREGKAKLAEAPRGDGSSTATAEDATPALVSEP